MVRLGFRYQRQRRVIGGARLGKAFLTPQNVAQTDLHHQQVGVVARQGLQYLDCGILAARGIGGIGATHLGDVEDRAVGGDARIGFGRQLVLAQLLQQARRQQDGIGIFRPQVGGDAAVKQGIGIIRLPVQRGGKGIERLGQTILGIARHVEGQGLSGLQPPTQVIGHRVRPRPEGAVQEGQRIGVPLHLGQDLHMRHHAAPGHGDRAGRLARQDVVGALEITGRSKRQRLVIQREIRQLPGLGQCVKGIQRLGHAATAEFGPGGDQPHQQRARPRIGLDRRQNRIEIALAGAGVDLGQKADKAGLVGLGHLCRQFCGLIHPPKRQVRQRRPFQQHRVRRIGAQGLFIPVGRAGEIVLGQRRLRGQIGAGVAVLGPCRLAQCPQGQNGGGKGSFDGRQDHERQSPETGAKLERAGRQSNAGRRDVPPRPADSRADV